MKLFILLLLAGFTTYGASMTVSGDIGNNTIIEEIIELRGEHLKVFALDNGLYEYRYTGLINLLLIEPAVIPLNTLAFEL